MGVTRVDPEIRREVHRITDVHAERPESFPASVESNTVDVIANPPDGLQQIAEHLSARSANTLLDAFDALHVLNQVRKALEVAGHSEASDAEPAQLAANGVAPRVTTRTYDSAAQPDTRDRVDFTLPEVGRLAVRITKHRQWVLDLRR